MYYPDEANGEDVRAGNTHFFLWIIIVLVVTVLIGTCVVCCCLFFAAMNDRIVFVDDDNDSLQDPQMGVNEDVRREHLRLAILSRIIHKVGIKIGSFEFTFFRSKLNIYNVTSIVNSL